MGEYAHFFMVIKGLIMLLDRLKKELEGKIDKLIEKYGFEVVEIQLQNVKNGILLRVFIDHLDERNVSAKDCEFVSRLIDNSLDVDIDLSILEVSSPGIDRLIKKEKDFKRFAGSNIKISLNKEIKQKRTLIGKLRDLKDEIIEIDIEDEILFIPLNDVKEARLYVSDEDIRNYLKRRKR